MYIHLNQAYSNSPAKRFLIGAMCAACRGGYVVFCTTLDDFWTGFENPRFWDMSLSRLFHLSNLSDTQILLQANQSRPFGNICVGIFFLNVTVLVRTPGSSLFVKIYQLFTRNLTFISPRERPRKVTRTRLRKDG